MKKILTQFGKNKEGQGLKDILSLIYHKKPEKVEMIFNTNTGIKKINIGWKTFKEDKKVLKGYFYTIPASVSKTNKPQEVFETSQEELLPNLTTTLIQMGFKDKSIEVKTNKKTSVKEIFKEGKLDLESSDDLEDIDFDNLERKKVKNNYKLGAIELLHKLFTRNKGNNIYWPNDLKYESTGIKKEPILSPRIKEIHKFKKLIGNTVIDYPLEVLTDFAISSSSFNVLVKGVQPIVLELVDGNFVEAKQHRDKILVSEGEIRAPHLVAELTKDLFIELKKAGLIDSKEIYLPKKTYNINIKNSKGGDLPLTNPIIRKIPQEEIVDLTYEIEILAIRQKVYNRMKKQLENLTNTFQNFTRSETAELYAELDIKANGTFNPKMVEVEEENKVKSIKIQREVKITIIKFPATSIEKEETELLSGLVDLEAPVDKLIKMLDWIKKEIGIFKEQLEEKRYKLNLIKNTFFLNGWDKALNYYKDEKEDYVFFKESTAKGVVGGKKEYVILENKDKTRRMKIEIASIKK